MVHLFLQVAQGYKTLKERTAVVRFKIVGEDAYFLAWTTTPWTLCSNIALCVNLDETYARVKAADGFTYIMAKALLDKVLGGIEREEGTPAYEIIEEYKGKDLEYKEYEPLYQCAKDAADKQHKKAFFVYCDNYVTMEDGTGIVHIAPAFGEDDARVGRKYDAPFVQMVDEAGVMKPETPFAGMRAKPTKKEMEAGAINCDVEVLKELEGRGILFSAPKVEHEYPHCWRCDTPLLYYPKESWFVAMSKLRDELVENNNKVNWYPETIKTGRFGKFLENVIDWGISRDRYWGTPLPIWTCEDENCGHRECIGSIEELKEKGIDVPDDIELHKPYIDNVYLKCPKCGKKMKRAKEVIDCWFDSGSMPFAQWHYPFENEEMFKNNFPAQYISEAIDQTRGWFYTLTALGTALFGRTPFENCIVLGHVLDGKGQKMSKSKKNGVDPLVLLDSVGADATRWYFYTGCAPWLSSRLSIDNVKESQRGFLSTLWNVYSFYVLYAEIDKFNPLQYKDFKISNVMDKWIISKLNTLVKEVDNKLDSYDITNAALKIESFTDELSNWYVRRNRERFWSENLTDDKIGAYVTLYTVLVTLSKVAAPFVPFMTEEIYQNLVVNLDKNAPESVHLCTWPEVDEGLIDGKLEEQMDLAYKIVKLGRSARNLSNIKNRQPLSEMLISVDTLPKYYADIVKEELNVKQVELGAEMSQYVDFEIKPNLPVLGKEYGKLIPKIKEEIAKKNQMDLANKVKNGKVETILIDDTEINLDSNNLLITMQGKEGFAFSGEGEIGVVLDTHITKELKEEGYIREILSKVQNMRKDKGFEVLDNINLYVCGNEMLEKLIKENEELIKHDTLTVNIKYGEKTSDSIEMNINGENLNIDVKKYNKFDILC